MTRSTTPDPALHDGGLGRLYRWGYIFPQSGLGVRRDGFEFYQVAPGGVILLTLGLGDRDYTTREGVYESAGHVHDRVVRLTQAGADRVIVGGVPISAFLGRDRVRDILEKGRQQTDRPVDAPLEAVIAAMAHLNLRSVALASRWAPDLNHAIAGYLAAGGIRVIGTTERGQHYTEALGMSLEEGASMALSVGREAGQAFGRADAIYVPGGAALSIHVIPALEQEFGKPVLTSLTAELWHGLVATNVASPIQGWGTLLADGRG